MLMESSPSRPARVTAPMLKGLIRQAGGICTLPDLAERWFLSRTRVYALSKMADFPEPIQYVGQGKMAVYLSAECDNWRSERTSRYGR